MQARVLQWAHLKVARLSSSLTLLIGRHHLEHRRINVHAAVAATQVLLLPFCGRIA